MNTQFERLEEVAQEYFKNLSNLSKTLGLTSQYLYSYKNRAQIGAGALSRLSTLGINIEYIKTGKGSKMDEELLILLGKSQRCKVLLDEKIIEIENLQKTTDIDDQQAHQIKLDIMFNEQIELIKQSRDIEKSLANKYHTLKVNTQTDIVDDDSDEIDQTAHEIEHQTDNNSICIYDLSTYSRTKRISSIEILPKSTMKIMLNIDSKEELFGLRVTGNLFESEKIFDGSIIIVEKARRGLEGQEIIYIEEKQLKIQMSDERKIENLIGVVKAVIQYR